MRLSVLDGRSRWQCPACGYVQYENPVPGVGILIEYEGQLVLVQRDRPPREGEWALPSGFIEADESVEDAAVREAHEETGLKIELLELFGVYSFPEGPPRSGLIIFYRAHPLNITELHAGDDARAVRLFTPDEFPPICFRTHREVIARWQTMRELAVNGNQESGPSGMTIRRAQPADHAQIVELMRLIPDEADMTQGEREHVLEELRTNGSVEVWVAESDTHAVVGFCALSFTKTLTETRAWLDALVVEPSSRRRGVGRAMFELAMRRARARGAAQLLVDSTRGSPSAQDFYRACGFDAEEIERIRIR
ncbi:MAG: bifunctional NUDIX hydrolase family protein/GNAT family N-acetyltransferase [Chloroflexi bacterium]|nr:bifunctional NUDIX hydrolase family protein/GNAT family N-acetyltransferase [Chloroflexota bacterium]